MPEGRLSRSLQKNRFVKPFLYRPFLYLINVSFDYISIVK